MLNLRRCRGPSRTLARTDARALAVKDESRRSWKALYSGGGQPRRRRRCLSLARRGEA